MEQTQANSQLPPYEAWPSVPKTAPSQHHPKDVLDTMDVDKTMSSETPNRRATSVLSMDDIEAAQALEGLRTGLILLPIVCGGND